MLTKEHYIAAYLMNSPRVVAEMLYDTITRYEEKIAQMQTDFNNKLAEKDINLKGSTNEKISDSTDH